MTKFSPENSHNASSTEVSSCIQGQVCGSQHENIDTPKNDTTEKWQESVPVSKAWQFEQM